MKISVITPSFNQGRFIEDAINSVITQQYESFEHIIIDGCSTDDTLKRLEKYAHLIWISEPDAGQSDAINKGLRLATGDIICWLNADDFYTPGTFIKVISALNNPKIHGVYSDIQFCDKEGRITGKLRSHIPIKWLALFHTTVCSESLFLKREILDNNILIDKEFHITMDKEFVAHVLFMDYKLKYIKDTFAVFRKHETNKSINTKNVKWINAREGLKIINKYLKINIPTNTFTLRFYRTFSLMLLPVRRLLKLL